MPKPIVIVYAPNQEPELASRLLALARRRYPDVRCVVRNTEPYRGRDDRETLAAAVYVDDTRWPHIASDYAVSGVTVHRQNGVAPHASHAFGDQVQRQVGPHLEPQGAGKLPGGQPKEDQGQAVGQATGTTGGSTPVVPITSAQRRQRRAAGQTE